MQNSGLSFMQLITGRLAQTFSELNSTIREQIKRRQSQTNLPRRASIQEPLAGSGPTPKKEQGQNPKEVESRSPKQLQPQLDPLVEAVQQQEPSESIQPKPEQPPKKTQKPKPKKTLVGHRPRKIQNAFKFYLLEMKRREDGQDPGQVTKIASKKWEIMSEEQKKEFLELQQKERQRYDLELAHFYDMNPEERDKDLSKKQKKEQKRKLKDQTKDKDPKPRKKDRKKVSTVQGKQGKEEEQDAEEKDEKSLVKQSEKDENEAHDKADQENEQVQDKDKEQEDLNPGINNSININKEQEEKGVYIEQFLDLGESDSLGADI